MTLAEFLHPLRKSGVGDQVVAALYYFKTEGRGKQMTREIQQALIDANMPHARAANLSAALARQIPNVHRVTQGLWEITDTGEEYVRDHLGLAVEDPQTPRAEQDVGTLKDLASKVSDDDLRDYLEEAIVCLQVGARRAAVVFLWAGAVYLIREALWKHGESAIEAALQSHNPNARFRKEGDFAYVRDADLLQVAEDLGIFDRSEKKQLKQALDLRNDCGHPVKYTPGENKVSGFIEDVTGIVFGIGS